ncbi:Topoisomerase IV subunit B [Klebsiella pneumoniae]|nr:Topoisomerase IV subunit B [Klebsiella pneumoniae]
MPGRGNCFRDQVNNSEQSWCYADGLNDYLSEAVNGLPLLPEKTIRRRLLRRDGGGGLGAAVAAGRRRTADRELREPDPDYAGGTHVNGLRQGLLDAMREFCEYRNILPRGVKLSAEDIWDRCAYVLSVKMQDPQFAGQTKERLSSRQCAAFVSGVVKDAFSLWLNQNVQAAELLAEMAISSAQRRLRARQKSGAQKADQRSGAAG